MKNRFLLFISILVGIQSVCCAQITTVQLGLKDTTANMLYLGIDNVVGIRGITDKYRVLFGGKPISLIAGSYEGRPADELRFDLRPEQTGPVQLQVLDGSREVFSKDFMARKEEREIWLRIGTVKDTFTRVNEILRAPYVFVEIKGSYLNRRHMPKVLHYILTIKSNDNVLLQRTKTDKTSLDGKAFDNDVLAAIKKVKSGDQLVLEDIRVRDVDGSLRTFTDCQWTIK